MSIVHSIALASILASTQPAEGVEEPEAEPETPQVPESAPPLPELSGDPLAGARGLDPDGLVAAEAEAYALYMEGATQFDAGRWDEAERTFAKALRTLPDDRPYVRSRGALALWWALCHGKLYDVAGDLRVLERERAILHAYRDRLPEIATSAEDRTHKQSLVAERLAEIDEEIRRHTEDHGDADTQLRKSLAGEYEGVRTSEWRPDRIADLGWHARKDDPRLRSRQENEQETAGTDDEIVEDRGRRPGVGLVVSGAVTMAAGVAGLGVMGAGMAKASRANGFDAMQSPMQRREQIANGLDGNTMSVTGAAVGSALLVTGVVLTIVGAKRMKKARASAHATGLGLAVTGRF